MASYKLPIHVYIEEAEEETTGEVKEEPLKKP